MNKKILASTIILTLATFTLAFQNYARRVFPIFTDPDTPCTRGSIYYHMITNQFLICKDTGIEEVGSGGGTIPIANATTTGRLLNTDWVLFNSKQAALGFTPENSINKNASNGYAGLVSGKIAVSHMSEVLSSIELADFSSTSGSGTTAIHSTISGAATNDVLTWNGNNWINQAPLVFSVFGRSGVVSAQTGDYNASQITNAFSKIIANTLTNVVNPANPPNGFLNVWADSTDKIFKVEDDLGTLSLTVKPNTCTGTDKVSSITSAGLVICSVDQGGAGGSGITSLNGLVTTTQTLSDIDDTNVTLTINSSIADHALTLGWVGTLADARISETISLTRIPNLTTNGFIKTTNANGTLAIDTNTYLTANQTITLTGNVTGTGTTTIATTIASNVVNGTMIAVGSDTQGDILFYNGSDWARLGAGASGQVLQTQGVGANPIWSTVSGTGDMILASVQTVTGAKTFDPTKLIVGGVSVDPSVVIGSFYRDLDDNKLYWGVDSGVDFWGEVYIAGLSGVIDPTKGGTGISSYTKGDILAASNATTLVKVAVGTNGDCLKADSGQISGLIWGACVTSGITTLNTLTAATQTFADVDDTNVTLAISSVTSTHTFTLSWAGTLVKSRQHANTLYTDDIQTISGAKTFDPAKLIIGSVSTLPSVVVGSFAVDSDDNKLYWGVNDTTDFWGEVFVAGLSFVNLTSDVNGVLPIANGGTNATTATAAFNGLDPLNTKADLLTHDGTNSIKLAVGTNGQCLKANSAQTSGLEWGTCGSGGSGDFVGPASSTDNAIVRFDGTGGKTGQNSGVIIDDSNNVTGLNSLTVNGAAITNNIVQNSQSAAYTTVLTDAGKHLYHPSADTTARTFTIDSNANVAYPIGTAITFVNDCSAGVVTISITSDTLVLAGTGTTGSRTLAACGVATAIKVTSTRWIINGTGLT